MTTQAKGQRSKERKNHKTHIYFHQYVTICIAHYQTRYMPNSKSIKISLPP